MFEVSTDKVDSEVPAPAGGMVTEILVPEGETVEVGTRLAVVGDAGRRPPRPQPTRPPAPAPEPAPEPVAEAPEPVAEAPEPAPAARARTRARARAGSGAGTPDLLQRRTRPRHRHPTPTPHRADAAPGTPADAGDGQSDSTLTSPIVRRLVAERGLDVSTIQGSGPGGRITRKDVLDAAQQSPASTPHRRPPHHPPHPRRPRRRVLRHLHRHPHRPPRRGSGTRTGSQARGPRRRASVAPAAPATPGTARVARDEVIPFDNIRRRTAEHMVQSLATSAHVYTSIEVDFERVERVRAAHRDAWKATEGFSLTYLPFIARAFGDTVHEFPKVNASVGDDALIVHHDVNLSIAVDLDFQGLVAPVIRDADGKRLRLIAREVHDLADRARTKKLVPDDVLGGTFTITNPGPFGTYATLPIINQPQVAILSTDGIKKRPVVVTGPDGDDTIAIHHTGLLVLTWDHRAFDGAYAAAFLRGMRSVLEQHNWEDELD